jgi:hypothetical protein
VKTHWIKLIPPKSREAAREEGERERKQKISELHKEIKHEIYIYIYELYCQVTFICHYIGTVFSLPSEKFSHIIIWGIHHAALTLTIDGITDSIWIWAVIKAWYILTSVSEKSWIAHTSADGILNRAPAVVGAMIFTVLNRAIVSNKGRSAHGCTVSIAHAVHFTGKSLGTRYLTWWLAVKSWIMI